MATAPKTTAALTRLVSSSSRIQIRCHAAAAWSLCDEDPERLAEWCLQRLEKGLGDESEHQFLRVVIRSAHAFLDGQLRPVIRALNLTETAQRAAALKAEKERVAAWDQRRQVMAEQEEKRPSGVITGSDKGTGCSSPETSCCHASPSAVGAVITSHSCHN